MARTIYDTASARQESNSSTAAKSYTVSVSSLGLNTFVRDSVADTLDKPSVTALIGDYSADSYLILSGTESNYKFVASTASSNTSVAASASLKVIESAATGKIDMSGSATSLGQTHGAKIFLKDTLGTQSTFTYDTSSTSATTTFGVSGISTDSALATKLATCINSVSALKITAAASGSVVTCTQNVNGALGNTAIFTSGLTAITKPIVFFNGGKGYENLHDKSLKFEATGKYSATVDTGVHATASVDFTTPSEYGQTEAAKGSVQVKTGNTGLLSGEYVTLSAPNQTVKFIWTTTATKTIPSIDDNGDAATISVPLLNGDKKTGTFSETEIYVQINGLTSSYDIADRLQQAIFVSGISLNSYAANYEAAGLYPTVYLDQRSGTGLAGNTTISTNSDSSHVEVTSFTGGKSGDSLTIIAPGGASSSFPVDLSFNFASAEIRFDSKTYVESSVFTIKDSSETKRFSDTALTMSSAANLNAPATALASAINSSSALSSYMTATVSGNRVFLKADSVGSAGNNISISWSASTSSIPAGQVSIQNLSNSASGSLSDRHLAGGMQNVNQLVEKINRSMSLSGDFIARPRPDTSNCEDDQITLVYLRPGTAGNASTIAFNRGVDASGTANSIAASAISLQGTTNSVNSAISAVSFTGGTNNTLSTATTIGVTSVYSSETPGDVLASAIAESLSQAQSYGVSSASRSSASGALLNVSSSANNNVVSITMNSAGATGNVPIEGDLNIDVTNNNGRFSGGESRFYIGTSRADYAANLVTLINTEASSDFSSSVSTEVVLTGSRATGSVVFVGSTATSYSSGTVELTSSNGISKSYQFSSDCGETGEVVSGNVMVYLGNVATSGTSAYADEFLSAFHHNNGHKRFVYSRRDNSTLHLTQRKAGSAGYNVISSSLSTSYLTVSGFSAPTSSQIQISTSRAAAGALCSVTSSNTGTLYLTRSSDSDSRFKAVINPKMTTFLSTKTSVMNNYDLTLGGGSEVSSLTGELAYLNPQHQSFSSSRIYNSGAFLNEILLNRNGVYGTPTWKMWNQSDSKKKVLDELNKNNLISVEPRPIQLPLSQDDYDSQINPIIGDGQKPPEGLKLLDLDDGLFHLPEKFKRTKLKRLLSTQIYYEPAVESRHKPLLYEFTSQTLIGQGVAKARQTLFNGLHFFTNISLNEIYSLKDGEAREYITGSLKNSYLYDFFKTAKSVGARNFYFRERLYPGELNCRRSVNKQRPEYEERELIFYKNSFGTASLMAGESTKYLSSARRLSEIRSFWRTNKRDRVRNIYDTTFKGAGGSIIDIKSIPTSSLNIPYEKPSLTKDGLLVYPMEISNYHFWDAITVDTFDEKGGTKAVLIPYKRHFHAGIALYNSPAVEDWDYGFAIDGFIPISTPHPKPPMHKVDENLKIDSSIIIATVPDINLFEGGTQGQLFPENFNDSMIFIRKSGSNVGATIHEISFHQPYDFSLLSMWPLDFPDHLYSRLFRPDNFAGGLVNPIEDGPFVGAIQRVGVAPNRIAVNASSTNNPNDMAYGGADTEPDHYAFIPYQGTNQAGHSFETETSKKHWRNKQDSETDLARNEYNKISGGQTSGHWLLDNIPRHRASLFAVTGAAGELIFSTKPTITLYDRDQGHRFPAPHIRSGPKDGNPYNYYIAEADLDGDGVDDYFEDSMSPEDVFSAANSTLITYQAGFASPNNDHIAIDPDTGEFLNEIFFHTNLPASQDSVTGYATATASMQYLRHAYPYYQPIWRLDKLTNRSPMYNSYLDFANEVHVMGRDYSVIPEYCISDHLKSYQDLLLVTKHQPKPIYKLNEERKIIRNISKKVPYLANFAKVIGSSNFVTHISTVEVKIGNDPVDLGDPIEGTPPAAHSHSAMTTTYTASKEFYDLDYGDYSLTPNNIESTNAIRNWRSDAQSAKFMPKYMHADPSENFAKLCRQNRTGFEEDADTIPEQIHLTFKAIKKLLPQKDLYPVNRTVTLGSQLIDAFSGTLNYSKKSYNTTHQGVTDSHKNAAATQSFLEPLMAPGILYNSIKSGMGVSYPIFSDTNKDQHPLYYGDPHPYGDWGPSAWSSPAIDPGAVLEKSFSDKEFKRDAKYLIGYGLASSMGISKSTPTYLMRKPTRQLPFEAIYKPDHLNFMSKFKTYMVDDFFDQNRGEFVSGNIETDPHTWTYPTSSIQINITHSGQGTMIPGASDSAVGQSFRLHWHMPETALGHIEYLKYALYFRGGSLFYDDDGFDAQLRRFIEFIPTKNNDSYAGVETVTTTQNLGDPVGTTAHNLKRHFKVGTSSLEYATNLAAAINSTSSYFPFRALQDDGTYADSNLQLFTASAVDNGSGNYGVKIYTVAPLVAPHNVTFEAYGNVAGGIPHPTATFGLPANGANMTASVYNTDDMKLYFKSSGVHANGYNPNWQTEGELTKNPKSNVAVKIAAHNFKPHVQLDDVPEFVTSQERRIYESSINNFLAETINFFIEPESQGRYYDFKMPIVASTVKQTKFQVVSGTTYYMSVNLYMGESHVMCEGPRFANIPNAGTWASASMRGAFFGPPMEVVHRDSTLNGPATGGYATEAEAMSMNLTDPAYHHVTPPYFYGPSSLLIKYQATGSTATIDDIYSATKKTSLYFEEYVTGMDVDDIDVNGNTISTSPAIFPTSSLSPKLPTTSSVSTGSAARMKLEQSVDVWKDGFSLVDIVPLGGLAGNEVPARAWIMSPKWVCPVLDFGLPTTIVRDPLFWNGNDKKELANREDGIKNTTAYYNYCTGRSMWLGYGVDPYDNEDLSVLASHLEDQKTKMTEIEDLFEQKEISDMQGKAVAHIVDPNQGPEACQPGKKGIYLQISETFPEAFGGEAGSSVTFATPVPNAENRPGYYTNREEVFGSAQTSSLVSLLGFDKTSGVAPRAVGKISKSKRVSEAIVAIPYFEDGFTVRGMHNIGVPNMHDNGNHGYGGEVKETIHKDILSTVQLIPGYHFLKIDRAFFEKVLGIMLVDRLTPPGSGRNTELRSVYKDFDVSRDVAEQTDLGQMIRTLLGEGGEARLGYVLPPELDFINNTEVSPFQMIVAPFHEDLDKSDLSNIWQNLAPDCAYRASKVQTGVTLRPKVKTIGFNNAAIHDLIGKDAVMPDAFTATSPGQFLNPTSLTAGFKVSGWLNNDRVKYYNDPPQTAAEFYSKLRWLVFKVKQRSAMDYDMYKRRQVDLCLGQQGIERHQTGDAQFVNLDSLASQELYGSNWPYDFFSLIEKAKMEIEYRVEG